MEFEFTGEIIHWRGPPPYHYVPVLLDLGDTVTVRLVLGGPR